MNMVGNKLIFVKKCGNGGNESGKEKGNNQ
jgi:hypothetical protein